MTHPGGGGGNEGDEGEEKVGKVDGEERRRERGKSRLANLVGVESATFDCMHRESPPSSLHQNPIYGFSEKARRTVTGTGAGTGAGGGAVMD